MFHPVVDSLIREKLFVEYSQFRNKAVEIATCAKVLHNRSGDGDKTHDLEAGQYSDFLLCAALCGDQTRLSG